MSTKTTTTPKRASVIARTDSESTYDYVLRLTIDGGADAIDAAESAVLSTDDAARLHTFEDRIARSVLAGLTATARAAFVIGAKPDDYAAVAKALGVSTDGGQYLGRKYSTLRECYRLAVSHTPAECDAFVAAYREATGRNPEQVREYVQWTTAKDRFKSSGTIAARAAAAETAAAKAAESATARRETTKALRAAKRVDGCPLTTAQWEAMPEEVLRHVAMLAESLAVAKGSAKRAAERAAKASDAAAETGPTPKRAARTKVAA